jgi:hypothetical protein
MASAFRTGSTGDHHQVVREDVRTNDGNRDWQEV